MADILFYYSASILPSIISSKYVANFPIKSDRYDSLTGDDRPENASVLKVGAALESRSIYPRGDVDWVKVNLIADKKYEFFTTNLNANGDTVLYLYSENNVSTGEEIAKNDDHHLANHEFPVSYDSHIDFNITETGTYYLKIRSYEAIVLTSYQLGVREYVDSDEDGYTPYYDCNDNDASIYVDATEIPGDGIDQDCSGVDSTLGSDIYESVFNGEVKDTGDNSIDISQPIPETLGDYWETLQRKDIYSQMHTLQEGDSDFFEIEIPAYSAVYVIEDIAYLEHGIDDYNWTLYNSQDIEDINATGSDYAWKLLTNNTNTVKTFYLEVKYSAHEGWYVPALVRLGEDKDGDGRYTKGWRGDCNDNNASINYDAIDLFGDDIDQNCDSVDGNNTEYASDNDEL